MNVLAASRPAVAARRPSGSLAMNAWPSWLSVNRAGSLRGIGNVFRGLEEIGQGDPPAARPRDARPGVQPRADQGQGVDQLGPPAGRDHRELAAPRDPRQGDRDRRSAGLGGSPRYSATSSSSRPVEGVWPRSTRFGARASTVGEMGLVARLGQGPAQVVIPAAVALDPVEDHDPRPGRPGRRPGRDVDRVAVGGGPGLDSGRLSVIADLAVLDGHPLQGLGVDGHAQARARRAAWPGRRSGR